MNIKKIMFPTDFSNSSEAALAYASSLAAETGALLYVVHVGSDSTAYLAGYGGFSSVPDLAERVEKENRALLNQVKPTVGKVNYQHSYLSGPAEQEILDFAEREDVDLIVIGSHGRTGLSRLLLGSVAEAVVRRAKCPVLTVKQPISKDNSPDDEKDRKQTSRPKPATKHSLH